MRPGSNLRSRHPEWGRARKTRRGIHRWCWWSCVCISSCGRRIRRESGTAPYGTQILIWGYSRSDKHTCNCTRNRQWGGWGWGPRHGLWGWPLRSSGWGSPPPSWRGSSGARIAMKAAALSPESAKERLRRCVHELVNNQMEASFILRWVKKGIKIQEQCIREVRKHYHCLWILRHWARAATAVMSTSLVTGASVLSTCRWGVPAWSTSLSAVTSSLHAAE
jgi:hypothetical protein